MGLYKSLIVCSAILAFGLARGQPRAQAQATVQKAPSLGAPSTRDQRRVVTLSEEVRHQLVTLPYYSVFDWLQANVTAHGQVTLTGSVVKPSTKSDAEARVKDLEA